ncbi:ABC transporter ATP-binding protein [Lactiplantibacillus plantarum]|nr:ABC transporter ATP-binding protein [Lactiplantibacillus plantarum subsp. plantarum]MCT1223930.1 ABC transporter ATP-binding protein [Lactiplantibacillus plantarum]RXE77403.1 ABC transporter ATP-binding protein [Lactiplantibacillus plantarum]RZN66649.1 ABC transporter ATP-binding protein [Lactiplantibacillus plantarum]
MVNTILKEADLFCPNSVRINFTIYLKFNEKLTMTHIVQLKSQIKLEW